MMKVKFPFKEDDYLSLIEDGKKKVVSAKVARTIETGLSTIAEGLMLLLVPLVCLTGLVGIVGLFYFWLQGHDIDTLAPFIAAVFALIVVPVLGNGDNRKTFSRSTDKGIGITPSTSNTKSMRRTKNSVPFEGIR